MVKNIPLLAFLIFALSAPLFAQLSHGGDPASRAVLTPEGVPVIQLTAPDASHFKTEASETEPGTPYRYGVEIEVNLDPAAVGLWEDLPDGSRIWRLQIYSPGAYSLGLRFQSFRMPTGGRLFLYNDTYENTAGAFTSENNKDYGEFATAPFPGDRVTLEVDLQPGSGPLVLTVSSVIHAFENVLGDDDYPRSGWCENNVACPEGDPWANEIRAVAKLFLGPFLCSGTLINNTRQDTTQYLLTAYHCVEDSGSPGSFVFMFNYQATQCYSNYGPTNHTVSGSVLRASSQDIYSSPDFALLELSEPIPDSYEAYYAGWSRESTLPQQPVGIHHPDGDIKKISFDYDQATHYNYFKWNVVWDDGVTEPGSSGSALFNADHRIVGDLSTGSSSCDNQYGPDQYGKLYRAWDYGETSATRLRDWLDPDNTDVEVFDGLDPLYDDSPLYGDLNEDEIINVQDVIIIINIILGNMEPTEYQAEAGDLNGDGIIDVLDIVAVVNLIMGTERRPDSLPGSR
ncbi:MAG: trypsin-like serine protease [FCB group bacterium]|nr:trypsin-like serine protease [FCB group bacterium]